MGVNFVDARRNVTVRTKARPKRQKKCTLLHSQRTRTLYFSFKCTHSHFIGTELRGVSEGDEDGVWGVVRGEAGGVTVEGEGPGSEGEGWDERETGVLLRLTLAHLHIANAQRTHSTRFLDSLGEPCCTRTDLRRTGDAGLGLAGDGTSAFLEIGLFAIFCCCIIEHEFPRLTLSKSKTIIGNKKNKKKIAEKTNKMVNGLLKHLMPLHPDRSIFPPFLAI